MDRIDLALVGGQIADVRAGALRHAAVGIRGERILVIGPDEYVAKSAREVLDATGRIIAPGYIEPHTHIVMANPVEFAAAVLPHGTTTVAVDALPMQILAKPERLPALLDLLAALPCKLRWLIRLHPPGFTDEDRFTLAQLRPLWRHPSVAAVGEVTRWTDVLEGRPDLLEKMRAARADGRTVEGHAAGASSQKLVALAEAGITSCHEAVTANEVTDRLRAGMAAMLRHSSIRPDLPALAAAAHDEEHLPRIMLTADGPTPAFIAEHGYMDYVVDVAIRSGIPALTALRMATLNPAMYFGMPDAGEVAVGHRADLVVLRSVEDPYPEVVIAGGKIAAREGRLVIPLVLPPWGDAFEPVRWPRPSAAVFKTAQERHCEARRAEAIARSELEIPVCRLQNDVITTLESSRLPPADGLQAALIDRDGRWISRCILSGYVDHLGGLATTLNTAFHLLVVGQNPDDMAAAAAKVAEMGGGLVVVEAGVEVMALPFDLGPFSSRPWAEVVEANRRFNELMRSRGFRFNDPLFSLLFLTFDSLPWIRLTSRGVWDVRNRRIIQPSTPL